MGQAQPVFVQRASIAAWTDDAHVEERRRVFGEKRRILLEGLGSLGLRVHPATSTFYLWVAVPDGETDASYGDRLLEQGIVVSPGSMFGAANDGFFRIALVPSPARCEEALRRWPR
jgi:aspartate/methionine/tyrosine aminotransferase